MADVRDQLAARFFVNLVSEVDETSCLLFGMCGDERIFVGDEFTTVYTLHRIDSRDDLPSDYMKGDVRSIRLRIIDIRLYGEKLDYIDNRLESLSIELRLVGSGSTMIQTGDVLALR
jgi:hypothetical protein